MMACMKQSKAGQNVHAFVFDSKTPEGRLSAARTGQDLPLDEYVDAEVIRYYGSLSLGKLAADLSHRRASILLGGNVCCQAG